MLKAMISLAVIFLAIFTSICLADANDVNDVTIQEGSVGAGALKLTKQSVDPAQEEDYGFVFTKNVTVDGNNIVELFYVDSTGNVKQITNGGKLNIVAADIALDSIDDQKIRLRNAQYLRARNAADNGDVNLIKAGRNQANDTDVAVLPDKVRSETNAPPTEDTQLVNKKYAEAVAVLTTRTAITVGQVYQATKSGFIFSEGHFTNAGADSGFKFTIKADTSNPPTTIRSTYRLSTSVGYDCDGGRVVPVLPGEYYKIEKLVYGSVPGSVENHYFVE